jgi:hypothetical protein
VRWPCFERQRAGDASAASAAGLEYHASISRKAAERHKSATDAGVPCVSGPECAGFKNGVALPANPRLNGKCGPCHLRMLPATKAKGRK